MGIDPGQTMGTCEGCGEIWPMNLSNEIPSHACVNPSYVKTEPLTLDEKQKLLVDIEDDFWGLLGIKYQSDADYQEVGPLIQSIAQCRQIQMSFPTVTIEPNLGEWELSGLVIDKNGKNAKGEVELYTAQQWESEISVPIRCDKLRKGIYKLPHLQNSETYIVVHRGNKGPVILYDGRKGKESFVTRKVD